MCVRTSVRTSGVVKWAWTDGRTLKRQNNLGFSLYIFGLIVLVFDLQFQGQTRIFHNSFFSITTELICILFSHPFVVELKPNRSWPWLYFSRSNFKNALFLYCPKTSAFRSDGLHIRRGSTVIYLQPNHNGPCLTFSLKGEEFQRCDETFKKNGYI